VTWLTLLFGCPHRTLYRERRELYGLPVMHWVCDDCEYAVPVVTRTAEEYRAASMLQVQTPVAKKVPKPCAAERARVVAMIRSTR
jgi:hypothetical protein